MRLVKFIATSGYTSRRDAERLIQQGSVAVNGRQILDPATDVTEEDHVVIAGTRITPPAKMLYVMFHKPVGVVSTLFIGMEKGLPLTDFIPEELRVHPVGRLDMNSSGLLLLTNDGELTNKLTHPSRHVQKEYLIKFNRALQSRDIHKLALGVIIDGRVVDIDDFALIWEDKARVVIHEGRKRILRELFRELGYRVMELKRVRIGPVVLGTLPIGKWRYLTKPEVDELQETVASPAPKRIVQRSKR